jgi:hypothetical protein
MWPLIAYDSGTLRYALDWLWTPISGKAAAADYFGQANPIIGKGRDYFMLAAGDILGPNGSGTPSASAGVYTVVAGLAVAPSSLLRYGTASALYAGQAMNISTANPPVTPTSSDVIKVYFERAGASPRVAVAAGETWTHRASYRLGLSSAVPFDPSDP